MTPRNIVAFRNKQDMHSITQPNDRTAESRHSLRERGALSRSEWRHSDIHNDFK